MASRPAGRPNGRAADHVVVGSGINALVAAALLAKKGRRVHVLERNDRLGGCMRTEALTEPGFVHDTLATTFTLFVTGPAMAALGDDLAARGVVFAGGPAPTGVRLPDGRHAVLRTDASANHAAFEALAAGEGDAFADVTARVGQNADLLFGMLGGPAFGSAAMRLLGKAAWSQGTAKVKGTLGELLIPARPFLEHTFASEEMRALLAPWCLHAGLGPEAPFSGGIAQIIAFALQAAGAPIATGGAQRVADALAEIVTAHGGTVEVDAEVVQVAVQDGKATGAILADGREVGAKRGVLASVSPGALYNTLLSDAPSLEEHRAKAGRYRHGRANLQVHYALDGVPDWGAPALAEVALLHLTPGLDGVSRAVNEAERGLIPAEPTLCVGQPHVQDPGRCPQGKAILWVQLPEMPSRVKGDADGTIAASPDGRWTEALGEAVADRVDAILRRNMSNFDTVRRTRRAVTPTDLEALNPNLVGGDPYGGACGIDQFFLFRPFADSLNHETPIKGLMHIGASTHPGPGLSGGSGVLAAGRA